MRGDEVATDDRRCAEAEERGHNIETPDQNHRPNHADAGGPGIGHSVEAYQNVG